MAEDFIRVRGGLKLFPIGEQILDALGADVHNEVLVFFYVPNKLLPKPRSTNSPTR